MTSKPILNPKAKSFRLALLAPILAATLLGTSQAQDDGYTSVYAKKFPEIVQSAPTSALPVRVATTPVRMGQNVLEGSQPFQARHIRCAQVFVEFYDACSSSNIPAAKRKWQKFINDNTLPGEEYDCPTTARLCEWGRQELARAQALEQGKTATAQRIEKALALSRTR